MFELVLAVLQAYLAAVPRTELLVLPTDVSASAQGVNAASFDAAAAGRLDGVEVQLRQVGVAQRRGVGAWSGYAAAPVGRLSLYGGYEWRPLPNPISERGSLGLAWALSPDLRLGLSWRRLQLPGRAVTHSLWDVGLAGMPAAWVSWSIGVDAFNAPAYGGAIHVNRSLRGGLALRPWHGDPRFTVAADTRIHYTGGWQAPDSRMVVDLGLLPGLHLVGAYNRHVGSDEVYAGLRLDLFHASLQATAHVDDATGARGIDRWGWQLTLRQKPIESLVQLAHRRVEVVLEGNLQPAPSGLFSPGKAIPTVALQLTRLADNPSVDTVVLPIRHLQIGMATVEELRAALGALRRAGKEVIAELHEADDKGYLVAAAASHIHIDPLGFLNLTGFSMTSHFFADALAKVGIRFDAVGVGKYKSAPDALTQNQPRPEDQTVYSSIVQQAYASLLESLRDDRHLDTAAAKHVLQVGLFGADEAVAAGLADAIMPAANLARIAEAPPQPCEALADTEQLSDRWGRLPAIAVVPVVGTLVAQPGDGLMPSTAADAARVVALIDRAVADRHVVGIVVRINSPGGDVFAAETIWRAMQHAARIKPLAVSMGDVAASGGYYVAAPAGAIFAEPQTLTGSIGIFLLKPDLSGLLQWANVHRQVYAQGEHADWQSIEHELSTADRVRLQSRLEDLYTAFVQRVAYGRHLSVTQVRQLAEGRVYTGKQAAALGLVDRMGGLAEAIDWVRDAAKLTKENAIEVQLPERTVTLPEFLGRMAQAAVTTLQLQSALTIDPISDVLQALHDRVQAFDNVPLALMPWTLKVDSP